MDSTATSIPYQLRQNKVVDRYAFVELLELINRFNNISTYKYVGFGSHSLEDFKYLHYKFGITKMVSLEQDKETWKRQKFNKPISCIECLNESSGEFIQRFERSNDTIVWLDYTSAKYLRSQLQEFQSLLTTLYPNDIVKITLNANPSALLNGDTKPIEDVRNLRFEKLRSELGDLISASITSALMVHKEYPKALFLIIERAAKLSLSSFPIYFQPLTCFAYADGQQMLSVTGIILEKGQEEENIKNFWSRTGILNWKLSKTNWSENPTIINIPDLTIRERLLVDSLLPDHPIEKIQEELGFLFSSKPKESLKMLETYALFYRHAPHFSRIIF
jgi:hypothetical protein